MNREEVYKVIDSERDYQEGRWSAIEKDNTIGDYLAYMQNYLDKARLAHVGPSSSNEVLESLRKVTALGVACFERHGVPERK